MRLQAPYADVFSPSASDILTDDEAIMGLQSSLRSSDALRAILECARQRAAAKTIGSSQIHLIEEICTHYETHHKAVRDHCLDYYNTRPDLRSATDLEARTDDLIRAGKELYNRLREVILKF